MFKLIFYFYIFHFFNILANSANFTNIQSKSTKKYDLSPRYFQNNFFTSGDEFLSDDIRLNMRDNKLSVSCTTKHYFTPVVWKKYRCPNMISQGPGEIIATGASVQNPVLYGVNIYGRNGAITSELLIKQPMTGQTDGVYVCESYKPQEHHRTPSKDLVIIGGKSMYSSCYNIPYQTALYTNAIHYPSKKDSDPTWL